jgi:DNA transformation protein
MPRTDSQDTFRDFVVDQLAAIPELTCKRMFGGAGLYSRGRFFAIIQGGRLYFHTSDSTRPRYESAGMSFFRPGAKQSLKRYYEVPANVVEDRDELVLWAREAWTSVADA